MYYVSLKLQQVAYVARKPVLRFMASTWDLTETGTVDDFSAVKKRVNEILDRFVSDFRSENPK
jgi:ribosome maturation factor RimP